jgi:hypothetical protein
MDILKQAAEKALQCLDFLDGYATDARDHKVAQAGIRALTAALAQPERKPLTEEEIELAYREIWRNLSDGFSYTSAEWIEAGIRYAEKVHGIE